MMNLGELRTKKIAILGLGVNNQELAGYLLRNRCALTIRDQKEEVKELMKEKWKGFERQLRWEIGEKTLASLEKFDVVFRSPAIPYLSPAIQRAANKGVQIYSQTKLFFDLCPARIVGVTGTKGKGTTSTLLYNILKASHGEGEVYLAGNIGLDPFSFLDKLTSKDTVILELSSFQLQDLHKSPQLAILLQVTEDHLDHHQNIAEYRAAKANILSHQSKEDAAIVNVEDSAMETMAAKTPATVYRYTRHTPRRQSAWVNTDEGKEVFFFQRGEEILSIDISGRKLVGMHNLENIIPAVMAALLLKAPVSSIQEEVRAFAGLKHRLSHVGTYNGVDFYDDSIATNPDACLAALLSFSGRRIHLIAGGGSKGGTYTALATAIVERCASLSLLPGTATPSLKSAFIKTLAKRKDCSCLLLDKAVEPYMQTVLSGIHPHLEQGDVVLLSPAATSFSAFANYKERGDAFIQAVRKRYTN